MKKTFVLIGFCIVSIIGVGQTINPVGNWIGNNGGQISITVFSRGITIVDQNGMSYNLNTSGLNQYSNSQAGLTCLVGSGSTLTIGNVGGLMENYTKNGGTFSNYQQNSIMQLMVQTERQSVVNSMGDLARSFANSKQNSTPNNEESFKTIQGEEASSPSDVDVDIPVTNHENSKSFALIIGNENYTKEIKVPFAKNDATVFAEYCKKILGMPSTNAHLLIDGTFGQMLGEIQWLQDVIKAFKGEAKIILYYAGHGIPDEKDKSAFLLPIDGVARIPGTAIKQGDLYAKLIEFPTQSITIFLDACFSGAARDGMLAQGRGIAIKPIEVPLQGNLFVFSASSNEESALPYADKKHGLFTYFLLKKIQESKGDLSLKALTDYVSDQVKQQSVVVNSKVQNPKVAVSLNLESQWKSMNLK